jgi:predicted NAD/FAD-dependent oxidoreductase
MEFRLYEASNYLGGRIKSFSGRDYGASLLAKSDVLAGQLADELKMNRIAMDKENYYFADGMQTLVDLLVERIIGLIPYRNFRMRHQLVEIQKQSSGYELTFQAGQGQKRVRCERLVLAIPPSQWGRVKGLLELPEMEAAKNQYNAMVTESAIKLILPLSSIQGVTRSLAEFNLGNLTVRQIIKKHPTALPAELEVFYQTNINFSIDYIYSELKKKLQVNYPFQKLPSDQYYGWSQASFVQGAFFKLNGPLNNNKASPLQIIGDSVSAVAPNRIEGALQSAKLVAENLV